ncbi:MAG: uroporphyrinogen-III C-methyltransferase [Herpetosiphon sp.]|nr:uroporphyrinogen-III C-methyltransferase [Herpetosiphon sp.]
MNRDGYVSLIGAGPGDPELLTLKGLRRLQQADVIVYDALIRPEMLAYAHPDAELIKAGKRGGEISATQAWINHLLVTKAQAGLSVVRLKGGDPFIFGRGGEEAEVLAAAGIAWEVIPGITSAIAAPAYAGIPVTHREYASSVVFITGHEDPQRLETRINWHALAHGIDTLVFLMGVSRLAHITSQLITHGRPSDTPVAAVRWGSTSEQKTVTGTLATIVEAVKQAELHAPAVLVVGEVVRLRDQLNWFESIPIDLPRSHGDGELEKSKAENMKHKA